MAGWFAPSKTELDEKLDRCMDTINAYTDREIACVPRKWRTLLLGMRAGFRLPRLLDAVRMLYQDIFPLRCGGDLIMKSVAGVIQDGRQNIKSSISDADLIRASALFDVFDRDRRGAISEENLREIGFSASATADIMHAMDADGNKKIDLFEFMSDQVGDDEPDIFDILEHHLASADLVKSFSHDDIEQIISLTRQASKEEQGESSSSLLQASTAAVAAASSGNGVYSSAGEPSKHDARFLEILAYIRSLEQKLEQNPVSNERLKVILDGSIEASRDEDVVEALRFVYNEVGAIRIAGNMIFQIVTRYLGK